MKIRKKVVLPTAITILMLATSVMSFGQNSPVLDLQTAIELGVKNNYSIQQAELNVKYHNQLKSTAFELPKTEIGAMLGQYNTKAIDQNYTISQGINPFQFAAKKQMINASITGSELQLTVSKQQLTLEIRQSWNHLLYLMQVDKFLKVQDSLLLQFVQASNLRFETGDVNNLEKITAETKLQELRQVIRQNEMSIKNEKLNIRTLLKLDTDFNITDQPYVPFSSIAVTDSSTLQQNPGLAFAMQEVQIAMAGLKVERSMLYPDLKVGYFIQSLTGNQEVNGQITYYNGVPRFQGVTLGVSVPLFAGSYIAKNKAAAIYVELEESRAAQLSKELHKQFEQQIEELKVAQDLISYYEKSALPNVDVMASNAAKNYQGGEISYVEFLQANQTVLEIRSNYLNAIFSHNQAVINLQYLLNQ